MTNHYLGYMYVFAVCVRIEQMNQGNKHQSANVVIHTLR